MEETNVSQLLLQAVTELDVRVWIGLAVTLAVGAVEILLGRKGRIAARRTRQMELAKARGNMLTARLIHTDFEYHSTRGKRIRTYFGKYEYEVNGRTKTFGEAFHNTRPPTTLTMYYVSDPEKAFSQLHTGQARFNALLLLIPLAAGIAVTMLLGYRG